MDKPWRPNNWGKENNPRICNLRKVMMKPGCPNISLYWLDMFIEAGFDACLEALFKLAKESPTKTFTIDSRVTNIFEEV